MIFIATLEGKWKMRAFMYDSFQLPYLTIKSITLVTYVLIDCNSEKNKPLTEQTLPLLQAAPKGPEAKTAVVGRVLELIRIFESQLVGPYAMGDQFTLADIAFIPFFERLLTVGGFYSGLTIPNTPEYFKTISWVRVAGLCIIVRLTHSFLLIIIVGISECSSISAYYSC
jgi:hypothetical protein